MRYVILFLISFTTFAAQVEQYPSGLLRSFEDENAERNSQGEMRSIVDLEKKSFPFLTDRHEWREVAHLKDKSHSHRTAALYYEGRRITGHYLKTHYNNQGFLEYASSSLKFPVEGYVLPVARDSQIYWQERTKEEFERQYQRPLNGGVTSEPVIYVDPDSGQIHSALEMHLVNDSPFFIRHFILEEQTGRVLSEKQHMRNVEASAKVYKVSPFGSASASDVTLTVDAADKLKNSNFYVRREQDGSPTTLEDITPQDYTGGINADPALFSPTCTGSNTACSDQAFDGVNVYYHLSGFRTRMGAYFTELGLNITLPGEPIPVIVNTLTLGQLTVSNLSNNAQYVTNCRSDGSMPRCMVFLRPAKLSVKASSDNCGSETAVQFYDLAREALVIAHEYQHYITDTITQIVFGCDSDNANCAVGDALHEAISDYFAATYVTDIAGRDVTLVGEYGLQNCTLLQRQLNTLRVYNKDGEAEKDPHTSGLSWASGYWKLKTEYGSSVTDKLLLKSLTFLPTQPSFVDSVESLVRADKILYAGAHATRIRQLFYDELKVLGGQAQVFRDPARGIVEMGAKGCAGVGYATSPLSGFGSGLLFFAWLFSTLYLGKQRGKKVR